MADPLNFRFMNARLKNAASPRRPFRKVSLYFPPFFPFFSVLLLSYRLLFDMERGSSIDVFLLMDQIS